MPHTKIGLVGFGRVGRDLFRLAHGSLDLDIAAIVDRATPEALAYLLTFDTLHGRFAERAGHGIGLLEIAGRKVPVLAPAADAVPPWRDLGVDVVVETGGEAVTRARVDLHLAAGARRVLLCVPPAFVPDLTFVPGANDELLRADLQVLSNGSCTAHAAAPLVRLLAENFGIAHASLTTVHAYTDHQRLADVPEKDMRRGRMAAENIIPQASGAAAMIGELLPALAGKMRSLAINVPVANGSLVDLVCWHERPISRDALHEVVSEACAGRLRGILDFETAPIVSSDVLRSPASGVFDSDATMTLGDRMSKTIVWFDNSWGYVNRAAELLRKLALLDQESV